MKFTITPWKRGTYEKATSASPVEVNGYVNGLFGIRREYSGLWGITHIPSGRGVAFMTAPTLTQAKKNVAKLLKCGDWSRVYQRKGQWITPRALNAGVFRLHKAVVVD